MASDIRITVEEIQKIGTTLPEESIEIGNGGHTGNLHIGLSEKELIKRAQRCGHAVSSFYTKENMILCIHDYLGDTYALPGIAKWILDYKEDYTRATWRGCYFDKPVGIIAYPDGTVEETSDYIIVVEKQDDRYKNTRTGLPFDIVTVYLGDEE